MMFCDGSENLTFWQISIVDELTINRQSDNQQRGNKRRDVERFIKIVSCICSQIRHAADQFKKHFMLWEILYFQVVQIVAYILRY